jgi:CrcB protein
MPGVAALLLVAAGGATGAVLRYLLSMRVHGWLGHGFPWGTLCVNVIGSFAMGALFVWLTQWSSVARAGDARLLLMTGVLGGFTTFSAFSLETLGLLEQGFAGRAAVNMLVSVGLCLASAAAGMWVVRQL